MNTTIPLPSSAYTSFLISDGVGRPSRYGSLRYVLTPTENSCVGPAKVSKGGHGTSSFRGTLQQPRHHTKDTYRHVSREAMFEFVIILQIRDPSPWQPRMVLCSLIPVSHHRSLGLATRTQETPAQLCGVKRRCPPPILAAHHEVICCLVICPHQCICSR